MTGRPGNGAAPIFLKFFEEINIPFTNNMLDCDKITSDLYIRSRKAGDRITLCRRHVTKTLKKLFCEDRVENREQRIVVTDACDRVLYVEGYGVNLPFAADKNTRRFVTVDIRKNKGE